MASSCYSCGLSLVAVFMVVQMSMTRDLPSAGLLDSMPANCSDAEFCLDIHDDYPHAKIDELLNKRYHLILEGRHQLPVIRQGIDEDEGDCEKIADFGSIYEIIDEYDRVRVVVQSPKIFMQQIRFEQCKNPGRIQNEDGTLHFNSDILKIHNISCIEERMDYKFLVLSIDGESFESVKSKSGIPVCCTCQIIED